MAPVDPLAAARPIVDAAIGTLCTACVVRLEHGGDSWTYAAGSLDPSGPDRACAADSFFDLASLTKLATTLLVLTFVRDGRLALDTALADLVPELPERRVTLARVLTHTAGLNWWVPLYREASGLEDVVRRAAAEPLAAPPGATFTYSDLGFIMLTAGLARAGGRPFAELVEGRVLGPLGLTRDDARYLPEDRLRCAATELDATWRRRRLRGEVHDENAFAMGGVAGHAGLFGTAAAAAALARPFRDGSLIGAALAEDARREHAAGENARRGLGIALRAPEGAMCGRHFTLAAFGHSGFTGTSVWVDPPRDVAVTLLTNRVYFGRDNADDLYRFRIAVHEAIA